MVISVTLTKILGLIYIIPLSRLIGSTGMGIYSNAYNLYITLSILSTAGFPTAMGKLISEQLALKKYGNVEQIYRVTMLVLSLLSLPLTALMWFGAPLYSYLIALNDPGQSSQLLTWSVRAVAPSLLVVPIISGLRGYLIGFQRLEANGYSQALEQIVRVVAIVAGAALLMHWTHGNAAAGAAAATFAAFLGAVAALFLLLFAMSSVRQEVKRARVPQQRVMPWKTALKTLYHIALPISIGSLVLPIAGLIDSLTVQNLLTLRHMPLQEAIGQYGVLSRQAMQLAQLPMAFAMAIGSSILPAISHANALKDQQAIHRNVTGTLRSMFFMTFPVVAALWLLSVPIDKVLFGSTDEASIIASVALMGVFSSLELVSTYMLQGIGSMYRPVRNMFIGVLIKLVLNLTLIYPLGILGAAIATIIGYMASSTLNLLAVKKYGKLQFSVWRIAMPSLAAGAALSIAIVAVNFIAYHTAVHVIPSDFMLRLWQLVASLSVGAVVYVLASIRLKAVAPEELRRLPAIGGKLAGLAERIQPRRSERTVS